MPQIHSLKVEKVTFHFAVTNPAVMISQPPPTRKKAHPNGGGGDSDLEVWGILYWIPRVLPMSDRGGCPSDTHGLWILPVGPDDTKKKHSSITLWWTEKMFPAVPRTPPSHPHLFPLKSADPHTHRNLTSLAGNLIQRCRVVFARRQHHCDKPFWQLD